MRYLNDVALSGANTTTVSGAPIHGGAGLFRASVQAVFGDTTVAGTLKLQGSNDPPAAFNQSGLTTPTHWSDVATAAVTAGAVTLIPATELCYSYLRVTLVVTTPGTSTVTATLNAFGQ